MISAGQNYGGVNPYGGEYSRRPQTEAEAKEQLKKDREKRDKLLLREIAKLKKADPRFKTCPIPARDKKGEYAKDLGELCRSAKDKLDKLLSHKPDPIIAAAIRKDKLLEIPKEVFMSEFQRYYLVRYMLNFKTLTKVKAVLKKLKDDPDSKELKDDYNKEFWKFFPLYNSSLKRWFKRKYALVDGKIYRIPSNKKEIKAKQKNTDADLQCFDRRNGSLEVYEDCSCAIKGGSTECAWLEEDRFEKRTDKPAENMVRGRIYFNPASMELRLIPDERGYAPPKGFQPAFLNAIKLFLSRHKAAKITKTKNGEKREGGKKLLLDFLKADNAAGIFRNDDGHYVVDVSKSDYLVYYNAYNENIHKGQVFPAGIWLSDDDAKIFYAEANEYPPLRKLLRVNPFRIENTAYYPKLEDGKKQRLVPKDQTLLEALYEFADAIKKGKIKSKLSKSVVTSLHSRLESLCSQYLERKWRKDITETQWTFTKILQIAGTASQFIFLLYIIFNGRSTKKALADQDGYQQKIREKGKAALRNKRLRRIWLRRKLSWIPYVRDVSTEEEQQVKRDRFEKRRAKALRSVSPKEKDARLLFVKGEEIFEVERDILRNYPHWIVTGWDDAIKKYHAAIGKSGGEGAHPLVTGHSRSGKSFVHIGAFNYAAADWLYRHEKDKIEKKLEEIFVEDKEGKARWEKFAKESNKIFAEYGITDAEGKIKKYPETGEEMVKYTMARYKQISDTFPETVRGRKSGIPDPTKMQAGTEYRGAQAGRQAKLLAAGEEGMVNNFQEVYEALQQGKTRDGASESMGNLLKHAMGLSGRSSYATGIQENMNVSADTTGVRALMMARDQETRDFNGRWGWIPIKPWNPRETLAVMLDPGVHNNLELDNFVKIDPRAIEAAVRLGCKLSAPAGSGQLPRLVAWQYLSDAAAHQRAQGVRGTFELTADHVVEFAKETLKKRIDSATNDAERQRFQKQLAELERDPKKFGKEVMDYQSEHFMTPDEVRAYRDIDNKNFGKTVDEGKLSRSIQRYLLVRDPKSAPVVRKMALMIAANETIGDASDPEEIRISRAVSLSRKLYEIYERLPANERPAMGDTAEWTSFVNTRLHKVLPRSDADTHAVTIMQETIMRAMTPYKYITKQGGEPDLLHMATVAKIIEERVLELARARAQGAYGAQANEKNLMGDIAILVEEFEHGKAEITLTDAKTYNKELGTALAKYETAKAAEQQKRAGQTRKPVDQKRAALEDVLLRHDIRKGTLEHYLATKHMDADKFDEKEFVDVLRKASRHIVNQLGAGEHRTEDVDRIAADAIRKATLEVRGPDDPDKDPKGLKGGPKGGARGPGGVQGGQFNERTHDFSAAEHALGDDRVAREMVLYIDAKQFGPEPGNEEVAALVATRLADMYRDQKSSEDLQTFVAQHFNEVRPLTVAEMMEAGLTHGEIAESGNILWIAQSFQRKDFVSNEHLIETARTMQTLLELDDVMTEARLHDAPKDIAQSAESAFFRAYELQGRQLYSDQFELDGPRAGNRYTWEQLSEAGLTPEAIQQSGVIVSIVEHLDHTQYRSAGHLVATATHMNNQLHTLKKIWRGEESFASENARQEFELFKRDALLRLAREKTDEKFRPDPDKGPKGGARGPGGAPMPSAPKPAEPKPEPASGSDPSARAELIGKIEAMLPRSLKSYAKHVAVVCQRKPELLKQSEATQRAYFTIIAKKAMRRHPEVIGGSRKGVELARARRRSRSEDRELDRKERREEELRRLEHLRRLEEIQRLRRARRGI